MSLQKSLSFKLLTGFTLALTLLHVYVMASGCFEKLSVGGLTCMLSSLSPENPVLM